MKICRFTHGSDASPLLGLVSDMGVHDVTRVTDALPNLRWPLPPGDQLIANLPSLRGTMERLAASTPAIPLARSRCSRPLPIRASSFAARATGNTTARPLA